MRRLRKQLCTALSAHLQGRKVRPPEAGLLLWSAFLDLSAQRVVTMAGPQPIALTEIEAYAQLMNLPLAPRHVEVIRALDAAWLDHVHARRAAPPLGAKPLSPVSRTPISAGLIDAMFG